MAGFAEAAGSCHIKALKDNNIAAIKGPDKSRFGSVLTNPMTLSKVIRRSTPRYHPASLRRITPDRVIAVLRGHFWEKGAIASGAPSSWTPAAGPAPERVQRSRGYAMRMEMIS
jgi:hypothetical protein